MVGLLALLFGGITAEIQNPSGSWRLNWDLSEEVPYEETGFAAPPELLLPVETIVISVTETSATFYDSDGTRRSYALSGKEERSAVRGFDVRTRARWDGHTLRLELSPQAGLVVVENYSVDRDANQLLLSITVWRAGRRTGPGIRYVYDSSVAR
jgi:hypothetical protein